MSTDAGVCHVSTTLKVMGGRWKPSIIYYLSSGTLRFNELWHRIPEITQRMLTVQLRQLEQDGVVTRKVHATTPRRVEYTLSQRGHSLLKLLEEMDEWGNRFEEEIAQGSRHKPAPRCADA